MRSDQRIRASVRLCRGDETKWKNAADKARATTESVLWSEADGYYHFDQDGHYGDQGDYAPALLTDALCGQRYVQTAGPVAGVPPLRDILNRKNMIRHLLNVYEQNVLAVGNGQYGAINATRYTFTQPSVQVQAVSPGSSYYTAAIMYTLGQQTGRQDLMSAALQTAYGAYRTTYEDVAGAFWFDTPACGSRRPSSKSCSTEDLSISEIEPLGSCW